MHVEHHLLIQLLLNAEEDLLIARPHPPTIQHVGIPVRRDVGLAERRAEAAALAVGCRVRQRAVGEEIAVGHRSTAGTR